MLKKVCTGYGLEKIYKKDVNRIKDILQNARIFAIEPTFYDLENEQVNVKKIVGKVKALYGNVIRFGAFSHQGYAYYQSQIAPKAPGLGNRDLLMELIEECRKSNILLVVYTNSKYDPQIYHTHPDWVMRNKNNQPIISYNFLPAMCPNSPYLDYYKQIIREIISKYKPEVMYIDNWGLRLSCYCSHCKRKFKAEYGIEPPKRLEWEDPVWQKWKGWKYTANQKLAREIVQIMKGLKPDLYVVFNRGDFWNYLESPPEDIDKFANEIGDNVHAEAAIRRDKRSFVHINQQCMFGQAIGKSIWIWVEYPAMPWAFSSCSPMELKLKTAKVIANGGKPMVWTLNMAPEADNRGLDTVKEMFKIFQTRKEYFQDTEFEPFAALLFSSQTRLNYVRDTLDKKEEVNNSFQGFFEGLLRNHIPFNLILDRDISSLSRYKVLILPNCAYLSDTQCENIRDFVKKGGGLILTYKTSLYNEKGNSRKDFGLKKVMGCHYTKNLGNLDMSYMSIEIKHPIIRGLSRKMGIPVGGRYLKVEPFEKSVPVTTLIHPPTYIYAYPGKKLHSPGIIINKYGQGKVVYISGEIGKTFVKYNINDYQLLLKNAIRWVSNDNIPIETNLPSTIELSLFRQGNKRRVIHLVNCATKFLDEIISVHDSIIKLKTSKEKVKKIFSLCNRNMLRYEIMKDYVTIYLPILNEYEGIVIEYK